MGEKYRSEVFAAIDETMQSAHDIAAIDKQTMREFDAACLSPVQAFTPEGMIKQIRLREDISMTQLDDEYPV